MAHAEQAHGVGTLLLEHLASRAGARGVRRFVAEVLTENSRMWRCSPTSGLPVRRHVADGRGARRARPRTRARATWTRWPSARSARTSRAWPPCCAPRRSWWSARAAARLGGHAVLRNLVRGRLHRRAGRGEPARDEVCGVACHASVDELPEAGGPGGAVRAGEAVPAVAEQCGRRGCAGAAGDQLGAVRPTRTWPTGLLEAVRRYGMRMVGPNCLGVVNTDPAVRMDATFAAAGTLPGGIGLVTQSGGRGHRGAARSCGGSGLGLSNLVSTGDKYDVSGNDLLLWWDDDPRTRMAVLYLESFGNPRKFSRFARRLAARKPVLAIRVGERDAGQRAAASHTASTATPSVTRDALFRQAGVLAVDRLDELTELMATLCWQPLPHRTAGRGDQQRRRGRRAGRGRLRGERAGRAGAGDRTQQALRGLLPAGAATGNPVDTSAVIVRGRRSRRRGRGTARAIRRWMP